MAQLFDPHLYCITGTGSAIVPGAKLYWYAAGTTTPATTYSDPDLSVPNTNPVVADGAARFPAIWLGTGDYKYILTATDGTPASPIVTQDDFTVEAPAPTYSPDLTDFLEGDEPLPIESGGTGATTAVDAIDALGAMPEAGGAFTGEITRQGKGGYIHNAASGMAGGKVILQAVGSPPAMNNGDWLAEY